MHEEQQPKSEIQEIFQKFQASCVIGFGRGEGGNLNGIPNTVMIDDKPKRLIKVEKQGGRQSVLVLSALFTVKNNQIEYSARTEDGELDLDLLENVLSGLEQELRNTIAKFPPNIYVLNKRTQVAEAQIEEAVKSAVAKAKDKKISVPEVVGIIEAHSEKSGGSIDLLSTFLSTLEQYRIFYNNLIPALSRTSNLEGFNLEVVHHLESEIDALLLTVDFRKLTLGSEQYPDHDSLFQKMSEKMVNIVEQYKGQPGIEGWFFKFLFLVAFKRTYNKALEFVIPQLEKIAPMLRLAPGDRLVKSDPNQPPTEYDPDEDSSRDAH